MRVQGKRVLLSEPAAFFQVKVMSVENSVEPEGRESGQTAARSVAPRERAFWYLEEMVMMPGSRMGMTEAVLFAWGS